MTPLEREGLKPFFFDQKEIYIISIVSESTKILPQKL